MIKRSIDRLSCPTWGRFTSFARSLSNILFMPNFEIWFIHIDIMSCSDAVLCNNPQVFFTEQKSKSREPHHQITNWIVTTEWWALFFLFCSISMFLWAKWKIFTTKNCFTLLTFQFVGCHMKRLCFSIYFRLDFYLPISYAMAF